MLTHWPCNSTPHGPHNITISKQSARICSCFARQWTTSYNRVGTYLHIQAHCLYTKRQREGQQVKFTPPATSAHKLITASINAEISSKQPFILKVRKMKKGNIGTPERQGSDSLQLAVTSGLNPALLPPVVAWSMKHEGAHCIQSPGRPASALLHSRTASSGAESPPVVIWVWDWCNWVI